MRLGLADGVSLSRLALLVPLTVCQARGTPWALAVLAGMVATDLLDGRIARRLSTAGSRGALMDGACDALAVLTATAIAGSGDPRYAVMAGIMGIAFASYAIFSAGIGRFAYTRLGRYNGAACYVVVGMAAGKMILTGAGPVALAAEWMVLCLCAVVLAASAAENVAGILANRPVTLRRKLWMNGSF